MKKLIALALVVVSAVTSCNKFDDSEIWDKLNDHESRIAYLEDLCKKMNTDIVNLQTLVTALDAGDYIVNASPLVTGDGYTFIFKSGKSVVIYNGKDGVNGSNGINGQDGKDGVTPVISVKQDVDGVYYWTVNGEWLIVDGAKVRASAMDGTNGTNGVNAVTPKFAVISVGKNNPYNHPSESVLSKLHDAQAQVFRTDLNGTIIITSDGKNLEVLTER